MFKKKLLLVLALTFVSSYALAKASGVPCCGGKTEHTKDCDAPKQVKSFQS